MMNRGAVFLTFEFRSVVCLAGSLGEEQVHIAGDAHDFFDGRDAFAHFAEAIVLQRDHAVSLRHLAYFLNGGFGGYGITQLVVDNQ